MRRRLTLLVTIFSATMVLALIFVPSAQAVLTGSPSKFESGNDPTLGLGNMVVDTTGDNDWKTVTFTHLSDTAASNSDDSFTPGQKQDTTCPTVEGHKNPPKDDFTDLASYTELSGSGQTFLYGATIRYTANGNASENVELKQGTAGFCPGSTTLLARVPNDKLIAIDYLGGGAAVHFHVLTWVGSGACFVANDTAPCWGATVLDLTSSGFAEGGVNGSAITAANNPISNVNIVAGQFAEFGVNLAGANIIPAGSCTSFAQTVWESRSSGSSFVSSTKDVKIEDKSISNCGEVIIRKHTDPRGQDQVFNFTSNLAGSELTCTQSTATSFSLNDDGNTSSDNGANTQDCTKVPSGSYSAGETLPVANYDLSAIDCSASDVTNGSSATPSLGAGTVAIVLKAGDTIDCTFTNSLQTGAIAILKESTKTGNPLVQNAGAVFSYDNGAGSSGSVTDNGSGDEDSSTVGSVCVSGLLAGSTYTINETTPPSGYGGASETDLTATAVAGTNCTDNLPSAANTAVFTNAPLSDIQVNFRDGGSGETSATISCDNTTGTSDTTAASGWDTTDTETGVEAPTTVTCTITIDP